MSYQYQTSTNTVHDAAPKTPERRFGRCCRGRTSPALTSAGEDQEQLGNWAVSLLPSPRNAHLTRQRRETRIARRLSRKGWSVRGVSKNVGMAQNFIESRREQGFLLPPDVREWLPADHLAWFVIDAVAQMDLSGFYAAYRADGHGRAAYEPSMMVTLVLYAFATRVRSSRAIESHCRQDVAYRVITGNVVPDHATIARFVVRHEQALADLFGEVLRLCGEAGLVKPEVIAIDGTRMAGNANSDATRDFGQLAREIVAEHKATDEAEDELYGDARGDELPEQLRTREGRREFFARVREKLRAAAAEEVCRAGGGGSLSSRSLSLMRSGSLRARRAGRAGCARPAGSLSSIAGRTRTGSRARGSSVCCWRPSGWRSSWPRSAVGIRRTSSSRSAAAPSAGVGLVARRSRTRHPRSRLGR